MNCTFKPNLCATKKMNMVLDMKDRLNHSSVTRPNSSRFGQRKYSHKIMNSKQDTKEADKSQSALLNYTSRAPMNKNNNRKKAVVFSIDLMNNSKVS